MADEVLKRWDEAAQQWKVVASVTRLEVQAGGGGVGCWDVESSMFSRELLGWDAGFTLINITVPD